MMCSAFAQGRRKPPWSGVIRGGVRRENELKASSGADEQKGREGQQRWSQGLTRRLLGHNFHVIYL